MSSNKWKNKLDLYLHNIYRGEYKFLRNEEIYKLRNEGATFVSIAKRYKISSGQAAYVFRSHHRKRMFLIDHGVDINDLIIKLKNSADT